VVGFKEVSPRKIVHYFSVDADAERRAVEGEEYVEEKLSDVEKRLIEETSLDFERKLKGWLERKRSARIDGASSHADFEGGLFFSRAFYPNSYHSFFGHTHFGLIVVDVDREFLYEALREYVRELSRRIPSRWWKFDYLVYFREGKSYVRNLDTWEFREVDVPVPDAIKGFLEM
jgi:hypothetical protein